MWRLPVERAAISSAFTSGMPPPSSVASVRASCDVENLWTLGADERQLQQPADRTARRGPAA